MKQIKKMTKALRQKQENNYDINQYMTSILRIKSQNPEQSLDPQPKRNLSSDTLNHLKGLSEKPGLSIKSNHMTNKFGRKEKLIGKKTMKSALNNLNKSDNDIFGKSKNEIIQNKILDTNFMNQVKQQKSLERLSQKNQSMILNREIDEWHRKLRSSIPVKHKNNAGYPRIKLNVFLDQINK